MARVVVAPLAMNPALTGFPPSVFPLLRGFPCCVFRIPSAL
jgi:hypothetical protein